MVCNCVSDIDECKTKPCNHTCHNTDGDYYCTCRKGYELIFEGNRAVKTGCHRIPGNQLIKTSIIALCKYNNICLAKKKKKKYNNIYKNNTIVIINLPSNLE